MITIKMSTYNETDKLALYSTLQRAVTVFINDYCKTDEKCQTCPCRHVCYDLIQARDYAYKAYIGGDRNDPS